MADKHSSSVSSPSSISQQNIHVVEQDNLKSTLLYVHEGNFFWKGDYEGLQELIRNEIKLSGKWLSTGGDAKEFLHRDFLMKWHGQKSQRITVVKDNSKCYLQNSLSRFASTIDGKDIDMTNEACIKKDVGADHVADVVVDQREEIKDSVASSNEYKSEIDKILNLISELKEEQQKEKENAVSRATKAEADNKALMEKQTNMAAEILSLKSTIEDLERENKNIRMVLDIKQDEWVKVQTKNSASLNTHKQKSTTSVHTSNRFAALKTEEPRNDDHYTSFTDILQHNEAPESLNHPGNENRQKKKNSTNETPTTKPSSEKNTPSLNSTNPDDQKVTLVIGDSMVKNIDVKKIERAAGLKSICHSYSGAKVKEIEQKFKNERNGKYENVILHVGTNDLVRDGAEAVAKNMEDLIVEVKTKAKKIAVSNVVKRYDGRVNVNKVIHYNKLLETLSAKHNITYINNDNITESLLNGSRLHLNRSGDKALGSAFCSYLKSHRIRTPGTMSSSSDRSNHFLCNPYSHRNREWTLYLNQVRLMTT